MIRHLPAVLALSVGLAGQFLSNPAHAACTLSFTSPGDGASVTSPNITVYGMGGADAKEGDSGTVTATLNGQPFFNYSGSFTAAVSFLQSRGVPVTLRAGNNFLAVTGSAGGCSASDSMTITYDPVIKQAKNKGKPDPMSCQVANPINAAVGNKYQEESDYTPSGASPLAFVRSYNGFDGYWRHSFSAHLKISASSIALVHADGKETPFALSGGIATPDADELGSLVQNGSEWVYTSPEQAVSRFDSTGRLLEWRNAQGISYSLSYGTTRTVVTDSFGNTLSFTQDSDYQPLSLEVGDVSVAYAYDARARLIQLTRTTAQGSLTRTFHYENASYPRFLTGITDERGVRYATWTYDVQGRAISSEHAGGAEKTTLSYNADGSTTVTNELGKQTVYHYDVFQGVKKVVSIQGEPSANCPASNSTYTYNDRGQVLTKTDANGNVTQYSYNDRGLEVSRTEGYGTAEARTVTTEWDASRFLPVKVVEAGRTTTYSYDSQGRLLSQKTTVN
ncbi:DUF6531 domain-containing protein [Pseudomonas luteola]|uniref:DUF6531 domain-containing protein n=1 Tax=Pseudomonas luteola TaxID=47886 RepID=UPI00388F68AA